MRVNLSFIATGLALAALAFAAPAGALQTKTDAQIRAEIIAASIAAYPGSCPCPYNTDRAGRRCGARSAYSRPGGAAPKCYASDVGDAEVAAWRRNRR